MSAFFVNFWWAVLAAPFAIWFGLKAAIRSSPGFAYGWDGFKLRYGAKYKEYGFSSWEKRLNSRVLAGNSATTPS